MPISDIVFLAAGGTGGHLFPAEALAIELNLRGYEVHLITDSRAERFAQKFPASAIHVVASSTISSKNPVAVLKALWALWKGTRKARALMRSLKPKIVVGFGGYPTLPPLLASTALGIPSMVHEQNAVMGRANRLLAARVQAIAGGFLPEGEGVHGAKIITTGNPVRPAVLEAAKQAYQPSGEGELFNLVVFGGSQGAKYFSEALPVAISLLDETSRQRLRITQQARLDDADNVIIAYETLAVEAVVAPFFSDMAQRIADSHLVICRSGASTVSELSVIGRPSILVPYPYALDHDQAENAAILKTKGGAQIIHQADLSPQRLGEVIASALENPARLAEIAALAKQAGKPDATGLLADMVGAIANGKSVEVIKGARA